MPENPLTNPSIHPNKTFYSNSIQPLSHNTTLLFLPHHFIFTTHKLLFLLLLQQPNLCAQHYSFIPFFFLPPLAASLTLTVRALTVVHLNFIWVTVIFNFFPFYYIPFVTLLIPCFSHSVSQRYKFNCVSYPFGGGLN